MGEEDFFSTIKLPAAYQPHNLKILSSNLRGGNAKLWASQVALGAKNMPACPGNRLNSWIRKFPWRRKW